MKAMLWKEGRENLKWGALALLALSLMTAYMASNGGSDNYSYNYNDNGGILNRVSGLMIFVAPLMATVLGLLQVGSELRRDQWAFLVHRPTTRSTIFWGKAWAGIALYLLATGLPMLALGVWLATPGHVAAPFHPGMMQPVVADIVVGLVFYFAGMLTAIRTARWYGSRALGIAAAVVCVMMEASVGEFWQALAIIAIFVAVLCAAAWGSFQTTGTYERQPRVAKAALGLTMYTGSAVAVCLICAFLIGIITQLFGTTSPAYVSTQYVISREGRILRVAYEGNAEKSRVDLQGRAVAKPKGNNPQQLRTYPLISSDLWGFYSGNYRSFNRYFVPLGTSNDQSTAWSYDLAANRVEGYSTRDKKLSGFLGPAGYAPAVGTAAQGFEARPRYLGNSYRNSLLHFPRAVYRIDLDERQVMPIYTTQTAGEIRGATMIDVPGEEPDSADPAIAVALKREVRFFSRDGKALFSTPLELQQGYNQVSIAFKYKGARQFLWYHAPRETTSPGIAPQPDIITESARDGRIIARHTLPPLPIPVYENGWQQYLFAAALPPALIAGVASYGEMGAPLQAPAAATIRKALHDDARSWLIACAICVAASLLCALGAWLVARRCVLGRQAQWRWMLGVFALGPFGLLMMLCVLEWPARVACFSCGALRVVGRALCEHCHAAFPATARDGTEIFSAYEQDEPRADIRLAS